MKLLMSSEVLFSRSQTLAFRSFTCGVPFSPHLLKLTLSRRALKLLQVSLWKSLVGVFGPMGVGEEGNRGYSVKYVVVWDPN